jgi:hypothetical protein
MWAEAKKELVELRAPKKKAAAASEAAPAAE